MKGKLDLKVTRVLEAGGLALVIGVWTFTGTGPDGKPVKLEAKNADVLRRQTDGTWRFVIDNLWEQTKYSRVNDRGLFGSQLGGDNCGAQRGLQARTGRLMERCYRVTQARHYQVLYH